MIEQFKDICKFNNLIGNKFNDASNFNNQFQLIIEELDEVQDAYHQMLSDDVDEQVKGLKNLRGELCDLIVVCIGMAHMLGIIPEEIEPASHNEMMDAATRIMVEKLKTGSVTEERESLEYLIGYATFMADVYELPLEKDLQAINVSNMSKFCLTVEEVNNADKHFMDLGIEVEEVCNNPKYMGFISTKDQKDINGKYYSKGKLLKPPHWVAAELI